MKNMKKLILTLALLSLPAAWAMDSEYLEPLLEGFSDPIESALKRGDMDAARILHVCNKNPGAEYVSVDDAIDKLKDKFQEELGTDFTQKAIDLLVKPQRDPALYMYGRPKRTGQHASAQQQNKKYETKRKLIESAEKTFESMLSQKLRNEIKPFSDQNTLDFYDALVICDDVWEQFLQCHLFELIPELRNLSPLRYGARIDLNEEKTQATIIPLPGSGLCIVNSRIIHNQNNEPCILVSARHRGNNGDQFSTIILFNTITQQEKPIISWNVENASIASWMLAKDGKTIIYITESTCNYQGDGGLQLSREIHVYDLATRKKITCMDLSRDSIDLDTISYDEQKNSLSFKGEYFRSRYGETFELKYDFNLQQLSKNTLDRGRGYSARMGYKLWES